MAFLFQVSAEAKQRIETLVGTKRHPASEEQFNKFMSGLNGISEKYKQKMDDLMAKFNKYRDEKKLAGKECEPNEVMGFVRKENRLIRQYNREVRSYVTGSSEMNLFYNIVDDKGAAAILGVPSLIAMGTGALLAGSIGFIATAALAIGAQITDSAKAQKLLRLMKEENIIQPLQPLIIGQVPAKPAQAPAKPGTEFLR